MPKEICPKGTKEPTKDSKCQRRFAQMGPQFKLEELPKEISYRSNKGVNLPDVLCEVTKSLTPKEICPRVKLKFLSFPSNTADLSHEEFD
ncbi:hypothetical protein CRYUN_Cryun31cG0029400 [Craigia yunnanensis]